MIRPSPRLPQVPDGATPEPRPVPHPVVAILGALLIAAGSFILCGYATSVALTKVPNSGYEDHWAELSLFVSSVVSVPMLMIGWAIWGVWRMRSAFVPVGARWLPAAASITSAVVTGVGLWQGYGPLPLPPQATMFIVGLLIIASFGAMVTAVIMARRAQRRSA